MPQKVLLISADKVLGHAVAQAAKAGGYTLVGAPDSISATVIARKEHPDLVLLDLLLPGGGQQLLERMRASSHFESFPIVAVVDVDEQEEAAKKSGANACIRRNLDELSMLAAFQKHVGAETKADAPTKKRRILCVEDDPDFRMILTMRLRASGFEVTSAQDAAMAMMVAVKNVPDLVLLDLGLPAGGGYEVLKTFKNHNTLQAVPIIVVSAWHPDTHKAQTLELGAVDYVMKPFEIEDLEAAIHRALA